MSAAPPGRTPAPVHDVAVIGGGVVGAAIARELAGHDLSVALVEARSDVGEGTSKANTAILHTGFDAGPGTLESRLVARGHALLSRYARDTGIPVEYTGAVLVARTGEEFAALPALRAKAEANGYHRTELIGPEAVYGLVPALGPGALGGLTVPDEAIICPWTTTLALATDARARGAAILLGRPVTAAAETGGVTTLHTPAGPLRTRWTVNAAGLGADRIDALFGHHRFTVTPRRGELLVFDKLARPLVDRIVLPVPTAVGKGVLVAPTVYGNVLLGPTAEDITDRTATGTTEDGLAFLRDKGAELMPRLLDEEITAAYAGLRASVTGRADYLIEADPDRRYILVGGIRSTGLSASMAIAEHVRSTLATSGLGLRERADLPAPPAVPYLGETGIRPFQDGERIAADPAYGEIVCFCERVTAGEIRDACHAPLPARTPDGLRRRTRAMNGRCQGFYCGAAVGRMLTGHTTGSGCTSRCEPPPPAAPPPHEVTTRP
ncbi:NAD(P)/FAD-dependent oxidoreductase [Streptomyces qinzhouensis]|uniref:NAD(P)/FAD-dependent oxidoreductase n=1 Tax=Streptomyces qinzhouensis TaxID=2599401 RepID=A0A5B8JCJ8_9ACTN|nr:NAD(P)/FAD-dependent oxidoreductase [Streptomyces qinzhouensis]QDY75370.1 NAD(P)/FAD-dependent oxidoreductase [Streptomyces qinzhouensis]